MEIYRSCKIADINWGALPEITGRLSKYGIEISSTSVQISRYPDTVTYDSLEKASYDVKENGPPKRFQMNIYGKRNDQSYRLQVLRLRNIHDIDILSLQIYGILELKEFDSIADFLGLVPDEPIAFTSRRHRTAFIAHKFDSQGIECADRLARFLELLKFRVVTGRAYAPRSIAAKVRARIEEQEVILVVLTPGDDNTWLTQESIVADVKGKPLIIVKDRSAEFKPGLLADHEFIPFALPYIESSFIPILEGLRELGYLDFE
jgi:hypothetical protein